ncbi:hypothetical protein [Nonomuraea wenchangensis]|uniref:hypothetical protein n=1 Tax=Nonomuraea wenchangensis TaxID=568860 RepID=UPI0033203B9F
MTIVSRTTAIPIAPEAAIFVDRVPRCRMVNRLGDQCPSPAVDDDPITIKICIRHLREVIELVRERHQAYVAANTKENP